MTLAGGVILGLLFLNFIQTIMIWVIVEKTIK